MRDGVGHLTLAWVCAPSSVRCACACRAVLYDAFLSCRQGASASTTTAADQLIPQSSSTAVRLPAAALDRQDLPACNAVRTAQVFAVLRRRAPARPTTAVVHPALTPSPRPLLAPSSPTTHHVGAPLTIAASGIAPRRNGGRQLGKHPAEGKPQCCRRPRSRANHLPRSKSHGETRKPSRTGSRGRRMSWPIPHVSQSPLSRPFATCARRWLTLPSLCSSRCRATTHRTAAAAGDEDQADAQRPSRKNIRHALVHRSKTSGISFTRRQAHHLGRLHYKQSSRHSTTVFMGHDLRILAKRQLCRMRWSGQHLLHLQPLRARRPDSSRP